MICDYIGPACLTLRSDAQNTGSGMIDSAIARDLAVSPTQCLAVLRIQWFRIDTSFNPLAMAGEFSADGARVIPVTNTILDV